MPSTQPARHTNPAIKLMAGALLLTALLVAWLVGAPAGVRVAQATGPTLLTKLAVQNISTGYVMKAKVSYYNPSGQFLLSALNTILPNHSISLAQTDQVGLSTSYAGPVVIDADEPFGAVAYQYSISATTQGKNLQTETYTIVPSVETGTDIAMTQLMRAVYDSGSSSTYNSRIVIQNFSASTATVTLHYKPYSGTGYDHSGISVPPNGSVSIDLADETILPTGFFGYGHAISTQPIAVLVQHYATGALSNYSGMSSAQADTTLYMPQMLKAVSDSISGYTWGTGVAAISMDGTPFTATLTYMDGTHIYTDTRTAVTMAIFDQRSGGALASLTSFYGVGKLVANKPVVATVNATTNYDTNRGMRTSTYQAFPGTNAGTRVYLPELKKNAVDASTGITWTTAIAGQLVGYTATTVTLTYYFADGTTQQKTASVTPSSPIFTFDQRYDGALANNVIVSGVLTTDPPQSIVATVNYNAPSAVLGDAAMTYEGIAQQ